LMYTSPGYFPRLVLDIGTVFKLIRNQNELCLGFEPLGLFDHGTDIATRRVDNKTSPSSRSLTDVSPLTSSVLDPAPRGLLCHNLRRLSGVRLSRTSGANIIDKRDGVRREGAVRAPLANP